VGAVALIDAADGPHHDGDGMRKSRVAASIVLALIGLVWLGQGIGLIGGSAMTGSSFWAIVGVMLLVLAASIIVREQRSATK